MFLFPLHPEIHACCVRECVSIIVDGTVHHFCGFHAWGNCQSHSVLCDKIALLGCDLYITTLQQTLWISSPLGNLFCFMWVPHCTHTSLFIEIALRVCFPVEQQYWEVYQASQLSNCISGMMYQKRVSKQRKFWY